LRGPFRVPVGFVFFCKSIVHYANVLDSFVFCLVRIELQRNRPTLSRMTAYLW